MRRTVATGTPSDGQAADSWRVNPGWSARFPPGVAASEVRPASPASDRHVHPSGPEPPYLGQFGKCQPPGWSNSSRLSAPNATAMDPMKASTPNRPANAMNSCITHLQGTSEGLTPGKVESHRPQNGGSRVGCDLAHGLVRVRKPKSASVQDPEGSARRVANGPETAGAGARAAHLANGSPDSKVPADLLLAHVCHLATSDAVHLSSSFLALGARSMEVASRRLPGDPFGTGPDPRRDKGRLRPTSFGRVTPACSPRPRVRPGCGWSRRACPGCC